MHSTYVLKHVKWHLQAAVEFMFSVQLEKHCNSKIIASYHVNGRSPSKEKLGDLVAQMQSSGADIIKLVIDACVITDVAKIFDLLSHCQVWVRKPIWHGMIVLRLDDSIWQRNDVVSSTGKQVQLTYLLNHSQQYISGPAWWATCYDAIYMVTECRFQLINWIVNGGHIWMQPWLQLVQIFY